MGDDKKMVPQLDALILLVVTALLDVIGCSPVAAFSNSHELTDIRSRRGLPALFSTTAEGGKTSRPSRTISVKTTAKNVQPTPRSVATAALASAAASTYKSCSSSGAGAQVNSGSFATRQLEQDSNYKQLEQRDRSFARLLVATVERRLVQIDGVLQCCFDKYPKGKHRHLVEATLRAGAAQLLFLRKPPFAVVKETVEVLRIHHKLNNASPVPEPIIKFVNGVLRKLSGIIEGTDKMYALQLLEEKTSPTDNISPWLIESWKRDWGSERTKLICDEIMPRDEGSIAPHIDLTTKYSASISLGLDMDREKIDDLLKRLGDDSILLPQGSIRVGVMGDVTNWFDFDKGSWWVQDVSATIPAVVLTRALYDKHSSDISNLRVADMCAAPGGKTSQLLSAGFGHVTAIEANARRSRRLKENLQRLQFSEYKYDLIIEEGQNWIPKTKLDGILVDVPCSATGTGSRRPDVLRRDSNMTELLAIQEVLAHHCAQILTTGGIMVYSTCSLLKSESEAQVKKLVNSGLVETLPINPDEVPGFEDAIDENGWVRVIPGVLGGELGRADGFFVARLQKVI